MAGYIGKISAVVTANTSDLSRKLSSATTDVDKFAQGINRSLASASAAATASLEKIFTPLQRLERKLQTALQLNIRTGDQISQIQGLVSAAEQINKPLESAAGAFSKLTLETQAAFLPALKQAQNAAVELSNRLQEGGQVSAAEFERVRQIIDSVTKSTARLSQAQQLLGQGLTGNELQFTNPRLFQTFASSASLKQRAATLSPAALESGDIARQLRSLNEIERSAEQANAAVEALRQTPLTNPQALLDEERRLQRLTRLAEAARLEFERTLNAAEAVPSTAADVRRIRANSSLNVLQDMSDPVGLTPLPANPRTAVLGNLGAELTQLREKVKGLSDPLTEQLFPDVTKLIGQFQILARDGVGLTAKEVEKLRAGVSGVVAVLESRGNIAKNFLGQFGGEGVGGLSLGVDTKQLEQIGSRIEFVQKAIVRLGDQARGPVLAAMEALRKKAFELFQSGEFNTDKGRAELRALEKDLIRTAAAATGVSEKDFTQAFNAVGRGGDIGRRGFDKLGLAAQQAAFILDDFFSVTGGLDQRIRAIGNNVSQLGFLLGGTFGLFAGVVASIGAQIAVAYLELANGGAKAEDRTRSLNDALSRQKSLAEGIAEAFKSVAQSIEQSGFTKRTREIREQGRLLDDLRKKNAEQARERAVGLDVNVVRERAVQASLQRRIESSDSAGERVRLTRELQQSRERERAAADAAAARRPPTPTEVGQRIAQVAVRQAEQDRDRLLGGRRIVSPLLDAVFGAPLFGRTPFTTATREADQQSNADVRARAEEFARVTGDSIGAVSDPREQVRLLRLAIDAEINRISTQSVDRGVFAPITDTIFGTNRRADENIRELQDLANQLEKDIITGALNRISEESFGSILSAGETIASGLESVASIIGGGGSLVEVELERLSARLLAAQKQLNDANEAGDVGLAEAAQQQIDAIRAEAQQRSSVAQSLVTFAQALDRVSGQLITTVAQEARTAEEQARREMNRTAGLAEAGLGRPEDAEFAQRQFTLRQEEARRVARDAEEAQRQNLEARDRFEADARGGQLGQDAQQLIRQRDVADQILRGEIAVSNEQRVAAQRNREAADRQLGILFEDSPAGRAAAARANELDRRAAAENQALDDIERGRALAVTPAQQAGRELGDSFRQLQAAFDNLAIDQQQLDEARGRLLEDTARQQAPTIIGLRDAVANAVLQGPSRAALNVTDVSTVEGARELSRLLRGDDAARTQAELVTLQRESRDLLQVIADANRENADVAN